jgi:uncharacterized protein (TIGR03790 family)
MTRTYLTSLLQTLLVLSIAIRASSAWAGGGPENVLLLINSNSLSSKTIANHYIALRDVPASNIVYVDWRGGLERCQGIQFANRILKPAIDAIRERGLSAQIDYVVYSSDFPWGVDLKTLFPDQTFGPPNRPYASCTGATYLWRYVRDKNPALMSPNVNWYVAPADGDNFLKCQTLGAVTSRGFRSTAFWAPDGATTKDPAQGQNYLLSTMLGVTTGRGNTVDEVIAYLRRSAAADGTRPRGTFYYMKNNDVRSRTRHECYDAVAQKLIQLGVPAAVVPGILPQGARDVLGIMTGSRSFDFGASGSRLMPGAICDNLTSQGGDLLIHSGQTPLTEFLRHGAAGASGTVIEPLALQSKFALPSLFLHYARGCSLAESYYQSVSGPFQLLIVGDPLCQPWAIAPKVKVEGIELGQEVKGMLPLKVTAEAAPPEKIGFLELFVDGRLVARFSPGRTLQLDTSKLIDGYHELRVVAVIASSIQTRGRLILPVVVDNHGQHLALSVAPTPNPAATDMVTLSVQQAGATAITIEQNGRKVGRIEGDSGQVDVLAATFGRGPVALQARSEGPQPAVSSPVIVEIR